MKRIVLGHTEAKALYDMLLQAKTEAQKIREQNDRFENALKRIASNTCCDRCQEAALVAKEALGAK